MIYQGVIHREIAVLIFNQEVIVRTLCVLTIKEFSQGIYKIMHLYSFIVDQI